MSAPLPPPSRLNVRLLICSTLFLNFVRAFPLGALFDVYLFQLAGGRNSFVGAVEGVRGIVQLAAALPLGALADRASKRTILKANCLVGISFLLCYAASLLRSSTAGVFATVVLWGLHAQVDSGTALAYLTDITAEGAVRTKGVQALYVARSVGMGVAPAVQALLILAYGANAWEHARLMHVLLVGLVAELGVCTAYLLLREEQGPCAQEAPAVELRILSEGQTSWKEETCMGFRKCVLVPLLLELAQITAMFGSGCSVKFLPLFFKADFGFSPSQVCMTMASLELGTALYGQYVPRLLSRLMGRAQAAFATHVAANIAFYIFVILRDWRVALPLYVVRYSAMNSVTQLSGTLVMDTVSSESRGRWAGVVSLKVGVWSGTAFLGGLLADATGDYRVAFVATSVMHTVAALVLLPVVWLVPRGY